MGTKTATEIFAGNFKLLIEENNTTLMAVARALNKPHPEISRWANGHFLPESVSLDQIADFFGVTVSDMFNEDLCNKNILMEKQTDITDNYIMFYKRLFGENVRIPDNIVQIVNTVAVEKLNDRMWEVLILRYNLDGYGFHRLREIGEMIGRSKQSIGKYIENSERRLRCAAIDFLRTERELNGCPEGEADKYFSGNDLVCLKSERENGPDKNTDWVVPTYEQCLYEIKNYYSVRDPDLDRLADLIILAKGPYRTMRQYAMDADISATTLYNIQNKTKCCRVSNIVIAKLASCIYPDSHISLDMLMRADGKEKLPAD